MGHLCKKSTTGHLRKRASGHLGRDCICYGCTGTTVTLVASGLTACGCVSDGLLNYLKIVAAPNGTFTLTRTTTGATCIWRADAGVTVNRYNNSGCTGSPSQTFTTYTWQLSTSNGTSWTLTCFGGGSTGSIFSATGTGTCATGISFTNSLTCGGAGGGSGSNVTGGGSATVSYP